MAARSARAPSKTDRKTRRAGAAKARAGSERKRPKGARAGSERKRPKGARAGSERKRPKASPKPARSPSLKASKPKAAARKAAAPVSKKSAALAASKKSHVSAAAKKPAVAASKKSAAVAVSQKSAAVAVSKKPAAVAVSKKAVPVPVSNKAVAVASSKKAPVAASKKDAAVAGAKKDSSAAGSKKESSVAPSKSGAPAAKSGPPAAAAKSAPPAAPAKSVPAPEPTRGARVSSAALLPPAPPPKRTMKKKTRVRTGVAKLPLARPPVLRQYTFIGMPSYKPGELKAAERPQAPVAPPAPTTPPPTTVEERVAQIQTRLARQTDDFRARYQESLDMSWVYHDSALEGVVYSFPELRAAMNDASAPIVSESGAHPVTQEIRRHKAAIEFVREYAKKKNLPITVDVVKRIFLVLHPEEGDLKTVKFRRDIPQHRLYFHEYAAPDKIAQKLRQIIDWVNDPETRLQRNSLRIAARTHYDLVRVFPFASDSGKVARLLMNLMLLRAGYEPAIIHSTERQRYYEALKGAAPTVLSMVQEAEENGLASVEKLLDDQELRARTAPR